MSWVTVAAVILFVFSLRFILIIAGDVWTYLDLQRRLREERRRREEAEESG